MTGIQTNSAIRYLRGAPDRDIRFECQIADLIERQTAQIERMRSALVESRRIIAEDREAFLQCASGPYDILSHQDNATVEEYDAALRAIDEAMGDEDER